MKTATVTEEPDLEICASVVGACAARRAHSPNDMDNYFVDPLRPYGMVLVAQGEASDHRRENPFDIEGVLEIDGFGNVALR
jgi:hypothetical protein